MSDVKTRTSLSAQHLALSTRLPRSHPEHAESRLRDRSVVRDGQSQAEIDARVGGIDHAVIPQARRRVVGTALLLILCQDGMGDAALLLGTELLACARELI